MFKKILDKCDFSKLDKREAAETLDLLLTNLKEITQFTFCLLRGLKVN